MGVSSKWVALAFVAMRGMRLRGMLLGQIGRHEVQVRKWKYYHNEENGHTVGYDVKDNETPTSSAAIRCK